MNKTLIYIAVIMLSTQTHAQGLIVGFNSTDSGRNISFQFEKSSGLNEYSYGFGVSINDFRQIEMRSDLYRKKLYATKGYHHINLNLTYQRYMKTDKVKCLNPFIFYDFQAKYSTAAFLSTFIEYDSTLVQTRPEQGIVGRQELNYFGPFFWLENNVGIGFKAMVIDKFYIKQRLGVGVNLILGYDDQILYRRFSWFDWEFSTLMHFSIGMKLR